LDNGASSAKERPHSVQKRFGGSLSRPAALFYTDDPDGDIHADIDTVASDLRNEYFLLYRPKTLNHDGAFHRIILIGPERVAKIVGTSGFYAPAR
jgi:hypothetical protein